MVEFQAEKVTALFCVIISVL